MSAGFRSFLVFRHVAIPDSGEQQLLSSVGPTLTAGLPLETVEWKRSYGRPTQAVTLQADLLPLDLANAWLKDANKSSQRLAGCQVLHTYWFECPVSTFDPLNHSGVFMTFFVHRMSMPTKPG